MLVVLCGGSGTRMSQDSLPKPLTLMMAQPVLAHALRAVAPLVPTILFVYSRLPRLRLGLHCSTAISFMRLSAAGAVLEVAEKRRTCDQFGTGVCDFRN